MTLQDAGQATQHTIRLVVNNGDEPLHIGKGDGFVLVNEISQ